MLTASHVDCKFCLIEEAPPTTHRWPHAGATCLKFIACDGKISIFQFIWQYDSRNYYDQFTLGSVLIPLWPREWRT